MDEQGDCRLVKSFGYQDFKGDYHDGQSQKLGYRMPAEYEPHHGTLMIWPTRPGFMALSRKGAKELSARSLRL